jgi:type IV pilus assembly protein PilX
MSGQTVLPRHASELPGRQSGAVMAVTLIFLLILSMLGLSGMRGAQLQERMTGNQRDRNLALQAAEAALRDAERFLRDEADGDLGFDDDPAAEAAGDNPGLFAQALQPSDDYPEREAGRALFWETLDWGLHAQEYPEDIPHTAERPGYAIEYLGQVALDGSQRAGQPVSTRSAYRITARGVGPSGVSMVYLQSSYVQP